VLLTIFGTIHERCAKLAQSRLTEANADQATVQALLGQIEAIRSRIADMQRAHKKLGSKAS
jgi:hypothetical protein